MRAEIRRIHEVIGSATIYVTHDQEEALSLADRIVVMQSGEVLQVGTPEDLYARPARVEVAEFMGYRNQLRVRATRSGSRVSATAGGVTLAGTAVEPFTDGDAIAAIRADDIEAAADGPIAVTVESSQYHGDYFYCFGRTAEGAELFFRSGHRIGKGETVRLAADPARVLVYSGSRP
jgi:putative spermidine/putrescine transport system ATP-binding protein